MLRTHECNHLINFDKKENITTTLNVCLETKTSARVYAERSDSSICGYYIVKTCAADLYLYDIQTRAEGESLYIR